MNLRKTVAALLAFFVLSAGVADARGLLDFVLTPKAETKEYHSGSLTPTEALSLYTAKQRHEPVGKNKVWKPTRLFKLVYDEATGRAWAYILPNAESRIERPLDYATFVKTTGLNLLGGKRIKGSIS